MKLLIVVIVAQNLKRRVLAMISFAAIASKPNLSPSKQ